jgi:hypothetical protein
MMFRWRTRLESEDNAARLRLLGAEQKARRMAVEFNCAERIAQYDIGFPDCTDIRVDFCRLRWVRKRHHFLVHITVKLSPDERLVDFRWRVPR